MSSITQWVANSVGSIIRDSKVGWKKSLQSKVRLLDWSKGKLQNFLATMRDSLRDFIVSFSCFRRWKWEKVLHFTWYQPVSWLLNWTVTFSRRIGNSARIELSIFWNVTTFYLGIRTVFGGKNQKSWETLIKTARNWQVQRNCTLHSSLPYTSKSNSFFYPNLFVPSLSN